MEILSTSSPTNTSPAAQHKIEMVFRFWSPAKPTDVSDSERFGRFQGLLALIEDVVAAKRATVLIGREQLSVAGLHRAADALVVSRQVQHGLQGFRSRSGVEPVAVSIAINSQASHPEENQSDGAPGSESETQPSRDLVSLLKISKPAQVLLTHDLSREIGVYKGLPLRAFPGRFGVCEYLWTTEGELDLLQSESQLTLTTIPAPPQKPPSAPEPVEVTPPAAPPPDIAPIGELSSPLPVFRSFEEPEQKWWTSLADRKKLAAAAAAVVIVGGSLWGIYAAFRSSMKVPPPASQQSTTTPAPVPSTPQSKASPPPPSSPAKGVTPPKSASGMTTTSVAHEFTSALKSLTRTPSTDARKGTCDLDNTDIPKYMRFAEDKREARQYTEAERLFRKVLACEPTNRAAQDGLSRAETAAEEEHP